MNTLQVIRAGPGVTIQDQGRFGWQSAGVTCGGAVDPRAWQLGQRLIDHKEPQAAIEIPWGGAEFMFSDTRRIAVTGAILPVSVDNEAAPMMQGFQVHAGQTLKLGRPSWGVWSYVNISGGIATPRVLGSRSTVVRESLGGHMGRALKTRDQINLKPHCKGQCFSAPTQTPTVETPLTLRFIPGFQYDAMQSVARDQLVSGSFIITANSNRMGARLSGNPTETGITTMWSEGTCLGAIQIPPDGQPIVLLADRQTMGGYPKAGAVISSDCARLAQGRPGQAVRFAAVTESEADRILWLQHNYAMEQVLVSVHGKISDAW